jgi:hypothetical protein
MSVLRQYQDYYAIHLEHYSLDWAGETYDTLLVKEFPSEYLEGDYSQDTRELSFIYPSMYANKYYLDGIAEGYFSVTNTSTTNDDTGTVQSYTVKLESTIDNAGEEQTIFDITRTISTGNSVASSSYLSLPIYAPIDKKLVGANEKLILTVSFTGTQPSSGYLGIACANDSTNIDNHIKIPYAPSG